MRGFPAYFRLFLTGCLLVCIAWRLVPAPGFDVPFSTAITDRQGEWLGFTVADDGQFRFSGDPAIPDNYLTALLLFEDKRFFRHRGVDPLAMLRALGLNLKQRRVVSGGSTLTMQVVRLARNNPPRTIPEKCREVLLARRLEQTHTKQEILRLYATHAPFGGNVVGLTAACLHYFNRSPGDLSWGEAALLAVLPHAPALIFPGKNSELLKAKRDRLLERLMRAGHLSETDYTLAIAEPLPQRLRQPPALAPHLLGKAISGSRRGMTSQTTLDAALQRRVNAIVKRHAEVLRHNHIYNAAVLVGHIPSGEVRAYVGNAPGLRNGRGEQVDIITSRRSSGSILKPALYALAQQAGEILPATLLTDIPSRFGEYLPENFNKQYQGVVPADKALAASLNVPFVRLLDQYGVDRFRDNLRRMGITTLDRSARDYGLSLILGGAECTLWDLCNLYGGMAALVRDYALHDGMQRENTFNHLFVWEEARPEPEHWLRDRVIDAGSAWLTLKALQEVERPDPESGWKRFSSAPHLSWKTGTSFGFRDAWAVGVNAEYVIGVWVGNADGEGRPGLVGIRAAAPLLFEVAALLRTDDRLYLPAELLEPVAVCRKSGCRASSICPEIDTILVSRRGVQTETCPYHRWIHLDATGRYRVDSSCEPVHRMQTRPWFVLSPAREWYYTRTHHDYLPMPPLRSDCSRDKEEVMEILYPQPGIRVFLPRDWNGEVKGVVFEATHRQPGATIFWHVDDQYKGQTRHNHQLEMHLTEGRHRLYLTDAEGNSLQRLFYVTSGTE